MTKRCIGKVRLLLTPATTEVTPAGMELAEFVKRKICYIFGKVWARGVAKKDGQKRRAGRSRRCGSSIRSCAICCRNLFVHIIFVVPL